MGLEDTFENVVTFLKTELLDIEDITDVLEIRSTTDTTDLNGVIGVFLKDVFPSKEAYGEVCMLTGLVGITVFYQDTTPDNTSKNFWIARLADKINSLLVTNHTFDGSCQETRWKRIDDSVPNCVICYIEIDSL